jgi:hypothetical protein
MGITAAGWTKVSGVGLSSLGTATISGLLFKPQMIDEGDCGAICGIKIGRGNRSTRRKPAPAPLCPPQIPHDQTRALTRDAAVGSQRLTAWAMARPNTRLCRLRRKRCSLNEVTGRFLNYIVCLTLYQLAGNWVSSVRDVVLLGTIKQTVFTFTKKFNALWIQGILTGIPFRILCLPSPV